MPDIADERAAYLEALRRSEEAAGISRDAEGNEVVADGETPVAPELEGAVPVSASDQPLTPESAVAPPVVAADTSEQQQEAPVVELTVETLQQQLAAAEARLAEKDSFIGRQSSEVGDLRQAITEMQQQIAIVQAKPAEQAAPTIQITQDLIDSNPAAAVQAAFEQRNTPALEVAFEAWKEIDPFTAATWLADRKLEQQQQSFDAKIAEQERRIESVSAPLAENAEQKQWTEAFNEVKGTHPDFLEHAARLLEEVAPQYPAFTEMLSNGDAKAKATALSALYALDKMGDPAAVQQQLATDAAEAAAEAAAARAAAGVVVGQQEAGQAAVQKTTEELEQEAYISRQQGKPSLARGWTGRSA